MKTYYKGLYGASASVTDKKDGTARLIVRIYNGQKVLDKVYKTRKGAVTAWSRFNG